MRPIRSLVVGASVLFASMSSAQDQPAPINSLKEGALALQFGIQSNFTLGSFQGASIAFQYHFSELHAMRAGVLIGGNIVDGNSLSNEISADTSISSSSRGNGSDGKSVRFVAQYLWYTNPQSIVQFYIGVGPTVYYDYRHENQEVIALSPPYYSMRSTWESDFHQWGIGATGLGGVQWFPAEWIALFADYSESLSYSWSSSESTNIFSAAPLSPPVTQTTTGSSIGWSLSVIGVTFGLSVYF